MISVDIDPKANATFCQDLLDFDIFQFEPGYFDWIHASPPCQQYSIARSHAKTPRDLEGADALVVRTLLIMARFRPKYFTIENPHTGMMRKRPCMAGMQEFLHETHYCRYGTPFRKSTSIWTNLKWAPRTPCTKANPCGFVQDGRHECHAQKGPSGPLLENKFRTNELHVIPRALVEEWLDSIEGDIATDAAEFGSDPDE